MPDTKDKDTNGRQRALIGAGIAAAAAGAAFVINRKLKADGEDNEIISDAPEWTLRDRVQGQEGPLIGRSVTINRPRQEIYARWRDFTASISASPYFALPWPASLLRIASVRSLSTR